MFLIIVGLIVEILLPEEDKIKLLPFSDHSESDRNRILRRIFGPKRDENGEWRKLHNEELHSLYRSPNIVRVINLED